MVSMKVMPPECGRSDGGSEMTGRRVTALIAGAGVALFGFAAQAFADTDLIGAAAALPAGRVFLGLASIAFTAILARSAAH